MKNIDDRPEAISLLNNIKNNLERFDKIVKDCSSSWSYEESVYRFYYQSFKVFFVQGLTTDMVEALTAVSPGRPLNAWFTRIVSEGTGKKFKQEDNKNWLEVTRPILEAFFHARFFCEMARKYGRELEEPPLMLPFGWAAVLELYGLR